MERPDIDDFVMEACGYDYDAYSEALEKYCDELEHKLDVQKGLNNYYRNKIQEIENPKTKEIEFRSEEEKRVWEKWQKEERERQEKFDLEHGLWKFTDKEIFDMVTDPNNPPFDSYK